MRNVKKSIVGNLAELTAVAAFLGSPFVDRGETATKMIRHSSGRCQRCLRVVTRRCSTLGGPSAAPPGLARSAVDKAPTAPCPSAHQSPPSVATGLTVQKKICVLRPEVSGVAIGRSLTTTWCSARSPHTEGQPIAAATPPQGCSAGAAGKTIRRRGVHPALRHGIWWSSSARLDVLGRQDQGPIFFETNATSL